MKNFLLFLAITNSMFITAMHTHVFQGRLEVICGPMFAGKSEELIRRLNRAHIAHQKILVVKPVLDTRGATDSITSHNGATFHARPINSSQELLDLALAGEYDVIAIDEVQFFADDIVAAIRTLIAYSKRVIVAGLDLDYRSEPFGPIAAILALADTVTKLQSICTLCGSDAYRSQRIINGKPARYSDPIIMIGAEESYQARCKQCYVIES
jgi:thymidine kinase